MPISLLPKAQYPKLTAVDPQWLLDRGITLLMMDFDNTIVPYTCNVPTEEVVAWLKRAKGAGLRLCVVSNSKKGRVVEFCKAYDLDCITHAKKPSRRGILRCMERYRAKPEHCALVGDQIYTDTLGANRAGVLSILIPAIDNHNIWLKLRHLLEKPWIWISRQSSVTSSQ